MSRAIDQWFESRFGPHGRSPLPTGRVRKWAGWVNDRLASLGERVERLSEWAADVEGRLAKLEAEGNVTHEAGESVTLGE